ncbi:hypothetical protein [Streptacidiphilus cavernicola]|uniref:Cyclic nucleotide-binding domain-containing protein n=1 Tax=Streptacidiphilus cavernicola TaxID=3342716 RepID=A0ABV6VZI2_9ACTN
MTDGFRVRTLTLRPGEAIDYRAAEWSGALVIVEQGELEVECVSGVRACFGEGSVLTFAGLELRRLHSTGSGCLVVTGLSREPVR